jgi:hypothetical protein
MKKYFFVSFVFAFIGLSLLIQGCKSDDLPGEKEARLVLKDHFSKETYKGYIELKGVEVVKSAEVEHLGGRYLDMLVEATIDVKKDYVVSKVFTVNAFGVSEEVTKNLESALAAAQTAEEKEEILRMVEANSFSQGENIISGTLGFAWFEGSWRLLNMVLWPKSPDVGGM